MWPFVSPPTALRLHSLRYSLPCSTPFNAQVALNIGPAEQVREMEDRGVKSFEDLEVWRVAWQVVNAVYALSREPGLARDFGLCGQVQRAAVSMMSNVAEGFERIHLQEKLQFYNVARGSSAEVRSLLYVAEDNYPSLAEQSASLRKDVVRAGKLITGLIQSTQQRKQAQKNL
jgi:four helix bundle protein